MFSSRLTQVSLSSVAKRNKQMDTFFLRVETNRFCQVCFGLCHWIKLWLLKWYCNLKTPCHAIILNFSEALCSCICCLCMFYTFYNYKYGQVAYGMLALFLMFVMSDVVNEITCALATIIQEMTLEEQRKAILALKTEERKLLPLHFLHIQQTMLDLNKNKIQCTNAKCNVWIILGCTDWIICSDQY